MSWAPHATNPQHGYVTSQQQAHHQPTAHHGYHHHQQQHHHHQQQPAVAHHPAAASGGGGSHAMVPASLLDPSKTQLWMGELEPWMDEHYLKSLWYQFGENVAIKMIRDKITGESAGYCFIDFGNPYSPGKWLQALNGTLIPGTKKPFKLNWATGSGSSGPSNPTPSNGFSVFVGDIGPEVNDYMILQLFQSRYTTAKSARVVVDAQSGLPKGYGFVKFTDEAESIRAIAEMNGVFLGSRAIRVSSATNRKGSSGVLNSLMGGHHHSGAPYQQQYSQRSSHQHQTISGNDPNNTTVFVGGIDQYITEEELRLYFQPFGEIANIKIPTDKKYGFIQFLTHQSAVLAIQNMNGAVLGHCRVKVSWGHTNLPLNQGQQVVGTTHNAAGGMATYGGSSSTSSFSSGNPQTGGMSKAGAVPPVHVLVDPRKKVSVEEQNQEYYAEQVKLYETLDCVAEIET